jgi:hypothetical protein
MTSTAPLRLRAKVSTRSEASPYLGSPGDAVLIERGRPRMLVLSCPCGCGEEFPINLDPRSGPAWQLYGSQKGVSVFPSVWRETGCRSHYIIWRDRILLFGTAEDEFAPLLQPDEIQQLKDNVLKRLPDAGLAPFSEIATALSAVPWDVLTVCRQLVHEGLAREGIGKQRGNFGRATSGWMSSLDRWG